MIIFSFIALFLVFIATSFFCAHIFRSKKNENTNLTGILIGIAISPTILTIYAWIVMFLNPAPSFLGSLCVFPLIIFSILIISKYYFKHNILLTCFNKISILDLYKYFKKNFFIFITVLPLLSFLFSIYRQSFINHTDHDISVYLNEASLIVKALLQGSNIQEQIIKTGSVHPHSLSYSIYLGWGFATYSEPGFGNDLVPKFQVGLNNISALAGTLALCFYNTRYNLIWLIIGSAILLTNPIWEYQLYALSRDSYYLAPFFVFITLLLHSKPGVYYKLGEQFDIIYSWIVKVIIFLSLLATFWGHSLGIVYAGSASLAIGIILLFRFRFKIFNLIELWLVSTVVVGCTMYLYYNYTVSGAKNLGFFFPWLYTDNALQENWTPLANFFKVPSISEFIKYIFFKDIFFGKIIFPVVIISFLIIFFKILSKSRLEEDEYKWIGVFAILCITTTLIFNVPLNFEGIQLKSSFTSNLRYGFGLGLEALVLAILSVQVIYGKMQTLHKTSLYKYIIFRLSLKAIIFTFLLLITYNGFKKAKSFIKLDDNNVETIFSNSLNYYCNSIVKNGIRNIATDNQGKLYRCNKNSFYLFTDQGREILYAKSNDEFVKSLSEKNIDIFMLRERFMKNTRLYKFLESNWNKQVCLFDESIIFYRPEFDKIVSCKNSNKLTE